MRDGKENGERRTGEGRETDRRRARDGKEKGERRTGEG